MKLQVISIHAYRLRVWVVCMFQMRYRVVNDNPIPEENVSYLSDLLVRSKINLNISSWVLAILKILQMIKYILVLVISYRREAAFRKSGSPTIGQNPCVLTIDIHT